MADNGGENIGSINVSIGADYSPLAAAYSTAQSMSQQAGENIADALAAGAAAGADLGQQIADSLTPITPAADDAASAIGGMGDAAEGSSSKLSDMAEQLVAIGEALAITEGLKEFGSEALTAADNVTHATLALTQLTGSGDTAESTIQGLEALGQSDGLSFPSLLTAATRMTAMLPAGTDVTALLGQIANGAAVMGTDIESAATKFDQMTTAGTASARTLTALGLSLPALAVALNQVAGNSDATATNAAAMFKALDESDRITVLTTALSTMGGVAQDVAQQTFGGQWQQLENAWEAVMVQAGQALLPFISWITDLVKTDIVPWIQGVVEDFRALPTPIQDATIVLGLLAAAAVPVTGALAAVGFAVSGLSGLLPALGIAAASSSAELGIAGAAVAGFGGILGGVALAGITAAVISLSDLKGRIDAAHASMSGISQSNFNAFLQSAISNLSTGAISAADLEAKAAQLKTGLDLGAVSAQQYAAAMNAIDAAQARIGSENMAASVTGWTSGLTILSDTAAKATTQTALLSAALMDAQTKLTLAEVGYRASTTTAQQLLAAQNAVTTAQTALNASMGPVPGTMAAIDAAAQKLALSTGTLVDQTEMAGIQAQVESASLGLAETAYTASQVKVQALASIVHQLTLEQDGSATKAQELAKAQSDLVTAYNASAKAGDALNSVVKDYLAAVQAAAVPQQDQLAALQNTADALGPVMAGFLGLTATINSLREDMPNFGVVMTNLSSGPITGLQSALDEATKKVATLNGQMQEGMDVGQQYEQALTKQLNAQIALDQEQAIAAAGVQGLTDAVSLDIAAVAAAQAKYNDMASAYRAGIATTAQMQQATSALTSAQNALTAAQGQGVTLVDQLAADFPQLATAANTATAAIQSQTQSLQADLSSLNSVAAAVKSVEADMSAAFGTTAGTSSGGTSGGGSSSFGGPGWTVSSTGTGYFGQQELSATYTPNMTQGQFDAIVLGKSTLAAGLVAGHAAEQAFINLGYSDNFSPSASVLDYFAARGDTSTTSGASTTAPTSSGGVQQGTPILSPGGPLTGILGTTSTTSSSTVASTGTTSTSSAAINGGVYPDVTAHQAAGEIWQVSLSGGTTTSVGGGTVASSDTTSTAAAATAALAASATATATTAAASTIGYTVGVLAGINANLATVASQVAATAVQINSAVAGQVRLIQPGAVTSGALPGVVGGSGTGYISSAPLTSSVPTTYTGSTGPQPPAPGLGAVAASGNTGSIYGSGGGPLVGAGGVLAGAPSGQSSGAPPPVWPGLPGPASGGVNVQTVHVDFSGANFGGSGPTTVQNAVQAGLTQALAQTLRAAGARF